MHLAASVTILTWNILTQVPHDSVPAITTSDSAAVFILDKDVVKAHKEALDRRILVDHEERKLGFKADFRDLVYLKPGIERVPESGSSMLINGSGPYESRTRIYGVPLFSAAHFTNSTFFDWAGSMIATIDKIDLVTDRFHTPCTGAASGSIELEPGIVRFPSEEQALLDRPKGVINLASRTIDFSAVLPLAQQRSQHQLSWRYTNDGLISWLSRSSYYESTHESGLAPSSPYSFGDITHTGSHRFSGGTLKNFLWFAYDTYGDRYSVSQNRTHVPWGMGSLNWTNTAHTLTVNGGAFHQYYHESKRFGPAYPQKKVTQSGGSVVLHRTRIPLGTMMVRIDPQIEFSRWNGTVTTRTYSPKVPVDTTETFLQEGACVNAGLSIGAETRRNDITAGTTISAHATVHTASAFAIDPSAWVRIAPDSWSMDMDVGLRTTYPDIRGLPDEQYRCRQIHTTSASHRFEWRIHEKLTAFSRIYAKFRDHEPALSPEPGRAVWDPAQATRLWAGGAALQFDARLNRHIALYNTTDLNRSRRLFPDGSQRTFEWEIPWSNKSVLHLSFRNDFINVFLTGVASAGLPYATLVQDGATAVFDYDQMKRVPFYKKMDLRLQFNQPVEGHRHLVRFDAFLEARNLFDFFTYKALNIREYYWDDDVNPRPVYLEFFTFQFGLRLAFRV